MTETDIINNFLIRYQREFDFYQEAARLCAQQCEDLLRSRGIRAIVTYRAKRKESLGDKLEKRNSQKRYETVEAIYDDLADLAGVRIALYFPGKIHEVDQLINDHFDFIQRKHFPQQSKSISFQTPSVSVGGIRLGLYFPEKNEGIHFINETFTHLHEEESDKIPEQIYKKIFSGYSAKHYRVNMRLGKDLERFTIARIEIQVASVLIHAWSEVEHDLIYKPLSGQLSEEEYAILDELNGLVLAGEIALNRLEKAGQRLLTKPDQPFRDHYMLASYIYDALKEDDREPNMGKIDILYKFLQQVNKNNSQEVNKYLPGLEPFVKYYSVGDQIIDKLLEINPSYYEYYNSINKYKNYTLYYLNKKSELDKNYLDIFTNNLIAMEYILRLLDNGNNPNRNLRYISKSLPIDEGIRKDILTMIHIKDAVIHRNPSKMIDLDKVAEYIERMPEIVERLKLLVPETLKSKMNEVPNMK